MGVSQRAVTISEVPHLPWQNLPVIQEGVLVISLAVCGLSEHLSCSEPSRTTQGHSCWDSKPSHTLETK